MLQQATNFHIFKIRQRFQSIGFNLDEAANQNSKFMKDKEGKWSKEELQTYVLLLCANVDKEETEEELEMIRSKVSLKTFAELYAQFRSDSEKKQIKRIQKAVQANDYSQMELAAFRKEIQEIFLSDKRYKLSEQRLQSVLDNILY